MLEVEIQHIASGRDGSPERFLILRVKDPSDRRVCPIVIGHNEAAAILAPSRDPSPARPMTHDLLVNSITELGGQIQHIYIRDLKDTTFFADVSVKVGEDVIEIDARPSDSIALAMRARVPMYISEEVIDKVSSDLQGRRSEEDAAPRRRGRHNVEESTSPVTQEEREKLSAFSDLMETLSLDDERREDADAGDKPK